MSIEHTWDRVASWISSGEKPEDRKYWYDKFRYALDDFKLIPGGRITYAANSKANVTAHNCFVIPSPKDSREGIVRESLFDWIETMSRGGGVGINMSSLRPRGTRVMGVNGTSSGPVPWMELFTTSSKDVVQQGGTRRGAAMIILNDWHPDIMEFIQAKTVWGKLEGANISVGISNAFMEAVAQDKPWNLEWPKGNPVFTVGARILWKAIAEAAWKSGEPGVVFLERCNQESNLWYKPEAEIVCVNPCSEIPLAPYGCCLLATINAERFIDPEGEFKLDDFSEVVRTTVRMLDNVIDISYYPLPEYRQHQQNVRQMGIGITGLADALIKAKIEYGSIKSIEFVDRLYKLLAEEAYGASIELARERGSFPWFQDEFLRSNFVRKLPLRIQEDIADFGIRNSYLIAQQPSGTGSLFAGVNGGIEPVFSFKTIRKDRTGEWEPESVANRIHAEYSNRLRRNDRDDNGGNLPSFLKTAHELTPYEHIAVQAAAQKWCDQAISKTVNCPSEWTAKEVEDIFNYAWQMNLKSVAIYRDGSRNEQVLHVGPKDDIMEPGCRSGSCDI